LLLLVVVVVVLLLVLVLPRHWPREAEAEVSGGEEREARDRPCPAQTCARA
jgi:hypothetical protein